MVLATINPMPAVTEVPNRRPQNLSFNPAKGAKSLAAPGIVTQSYPDVFVPFVPYPQQTDG
jgi:hypothetical protein